MIKYLRGYIKQVGTALPTIRYIQNDFGIEPVVSELNLGAYNLYSEGLFPKDKLIAYSYVSGGNSNNYTLCCEYNTGIDDNSNIIIGIETYNPQNVMDLSQYLTPPTFEELYFEIGVYCEDNYSPIELSTIAHCKSLLYGSGSVKLIELADTL